MLLFYCCCCFMTTSRHWVAATFCIILGGFSGRFYSDFMFSVWKLLCLELFVLLKSIWEVSVCICIIVFSPNILFSVFCFIMSFLLFSLSFHHSLTASVCLCVYLCPQTLGVLGNFQQCEYIFAFCLLLSVSLISLFCKSQWFQWTAQTERWSHRDTETLWCSGCLMCFWYLTKKNVK